MDGRVLAAGGLGTGGAAVSSTEVYEAQAPLPQLLPLLLD
jgi:hypothetical protein